MKATLPILLLSVCVGLIITEDTNTFDGDILEQVQRYCPYLDMCHSESNQTFRGLENEVACCGHCLCDDNCLQTHSCCPDYIDHFATATEMLEIKADTTECVYAQWREFDHKKYNGKSYTMVSRCPDEYTENDDVKHRCSKDYHQFDINGNLKYLPPLSSTESKTIYKNYYCVVCHGFDTSTLRQWMSEVVCTKHPQLYFTNINDIQEILATEDDCQLKFKPPSEENWVDDILCDRLVDRCNVTGHWEQYALEVESACLSYLSPYRDYKNVHCYICNNFNVTYIEDTCLLPESQSAPPSFIALLDFMDLERDASTEDKPQQCDHLSVFDAEVDICRPMVCPAGFRIVGMECIPLLKNLPRSIFGIVIEIPFILVPSAIARQDTLLDVYNIAQMVANTAVQNVGLIQTSRYNRICANNVYVKLQSNITDMLDNMIAMNDTNVAPYVSHIEVLVQISTQQINNMTTLINEIALLFLENEYYAQYHIRYKQLGYNYNQVGVRTRSVVMDKIRAVERVIGDHLEFETFIAIVEGFDDPIDGLGVVLVPEHDYEAEWERMLIVQPNPFCPRIELSDAEFDMSISTNSATRRNMLTTSVTTPTATITPTPTATATPRPTISYNFSSMIHTANGSGILVCADEFIKQSSKQTNTLQEIDPDRNQEVILTIVCLSVALVSLVLTLIVYAILPQLRTLPGMNIMALSSAMIVFYTLSLTNSLIEISTTSVTCQALGIILHFSLLSVFAWMFICTYHLMRVFCTIKEKSQAHHDKKVFIRYSLFTVLVPLLIVCCTVISSVVSNNGIGYGGKPCYVKLSTFLLYFVAIPLAIVVVANTIMFSFVTTTVLRMPHVASSTNKERNNLLIFLKLSTLTGFAWVFGFLYQFTEMLLFAYLFIICNAGQGLFIMLSFVANEQVFGMLREKMKYISENSSKSTRTGNTTIEKSKIDANNIDIKETATSDTRF